MTVSAIDKSNRDARFRRIKTFLREQGLQAAYITGAKGYDGCYCFTAGPGKTVNMDYYHILFPVSGDPVLFMGTRKRMAPLLRYLALGDANWIPDGIPDEREELAAQIRKFDLSHARIGIIGDVINFRDIQRLRDLAPQAELVDISDAFTEMMRGNDAPALQDMVRSMEIVNEGCDALEELYRETNRVSYVNAALDFRMFRQGADYTYNRIVRQFREPRHMDEDRDRMLPGDVYYAEITCCYHGFWIQRVVVFCLGGLNKEYERLFRANLKAHDAALSAVKTGKSTAEILDVINESVREDGLIPPRDFVTLPPAHLVGMKIDMGTFAYNAPFELSDSMAFVVHVSSKTPETGNSLFGPGHAYLLRDGVPVLVSEVQREIKVFP